MNAEIFLCDSTLPKIEQSLEDSRSILNIGESSETTKKLPKEENVNMTLTFQAYFEEVVEMGDNEELRIRRCNIFYFMENGTIAVVEKPQMNSVWHKEH